MIDTGERHHLNSVIIDEADYYVHLMHQATYKFALAYVKGKTVLDYGCGTGYGAQILAKEAAYVIATDISDETVDFANKTFSTNNLEFKKFNDLDSSLTKFDVITSFQVIEHIYNEKEYIRNLRNRLNPGGYLIISTPDRINRLYAIQKPWNIFHVKEYSEKSLHPLLKIFFNDIKVFMTSSYPEFVKFEIDRRKKQRLITLPCTLFFYPAFLRHWLLKIEARLFKLIKRILKGNESVNIGRGTQSGNPIFKYTFSDIQISESPQNATDLIVVCRLDFT